MVCKFCGRPKEDISKGICSSCSAAIIKYKRNLHNDAAFKEWFEKVCESNMVAGRFVPSCYPLKVRQLAVCPCCGKKPEKVYMKDQSQCDECGRLESKYRNYLHRLTIRYSSKLMASVDEICDEYRDRMNRGLKVPNVYKKNLL